MRLARPLRQFWLGPALLLTGCHPKPPLPVWTQEPRDPTVGFREFTCLDGSKALAVLPGDAKISVGDGERALSAYCTLTGAHLQRHGSVYLASLLKDQFGSCDCVCADLSQPTPWWIMVSSAQLGRATTDCVALVKQLNLQVPWDQMRLTKPPKSSGVRVDLGEYTAQLPAGWFDIMDHLGGPPTELASSIVRQHCAGWIDFHRSKQGRALPKYMNGNVVGRCDLGDLTIWLQASRGADRELQKRAPEIIEAIRHATLKSSGTPR